MWAAPGVGCWNATVVNSTEQLGNKCQRNRFVMHRTKTISFWRQASSKDQAYWPAKESLAPNWLCWGCTLQAWSRLAKPCDLSTWWTFWKLMICYCSSTSDQHRLSALRGGGGLVYTQVLLVNSHQLTPVIASCKRHKGADSSADDTTAKGRFIRAGWLHRPEHTMNVILHTSLLHPESAVSFWEQQGFCGIWKQDVTPS